MSIRFDKKVAVITGAAMGIGEATARTLAGLGASVALLDRNEEALVKTARALGGTAVSVRRFQGSRRGARHDRHSG